MQQVEATRGNIVLKVWFRLSWTDLRLTWDPEEYGGVKFVHVHTDTAPSTSRPGEIWLPDIQPYNAVRGITHTLEPALAKVSHDGSVFWSRTGVLDIMCKFSGLVNFPFDILKCQLEVGGWLMSGIQQGVTLTGPGFVFSKQEKTSGSSYQEYVMIGVQADTDVHYYPCCPEEPWPIVMYTLSFKRASLFYVFVIICPSIIITLLSFVVILD